MAVLSGKFSNGSNLEDPMAQAGFVVTISHQENDLTEGP